MMLRLKHESELAKLRLRLDATDRTKVVSLDGLTATIPSAVSAPTSKQIPDDVDQRLALALREWGWIEPDEMIWIKPDGPALGNNVFPRRSWESILWFSKKRKPYCDAKANGRPCDNIGQCGFSAKGQGNWVRGVKDRRINGIARCRDIVPMLVALNARGNSHPAQYPAELAEWIVRLLCPEFGVVLDPFMGAGSTAEGVLRAGGERRYVGIDVNAQYCREAEARIEAFIGNLLNEKE